MAHGGTIVRRSGSHTTHGTHPECSGNAPPTAARAHAWRGGYPYHAHFDLAAGSTHPPPTYMLIVRPGTPPTFAPPASRRQHNVLFTAAALCTPGERVFLTLFQTRRPQHNARHQSQRPAPYARHHHNARQQRPTSSQRPAPPTPGPPPPQQLPRPSHPR